jgi:hypothetical protein|tara:strand:+ start:184 stop:636 length:453 start_codon:yes stop_codon:yes gene_type:complete
MSTRAIIRFAKREDGVSFSEHPQKVTHQIYHHYDGYPDFLGVALAEFIYKDGTTRRYNGVDCLAAQVLTHLKLGIHYGKCSIDEFNVYLETPEPTDACLMRCVDYIYYIWTKDETDEVWISIFDYTGDCIFVGQSRNLIFRYKLNTNTDG